MQITAISTANCHSKQASGQHRPAKQIHILIHYVTTIAIVLIFLQYYFRDNMNNNFIIENNHDLFLYTRYYIRMNT
uniref:Uncharacterized protein n=1 Tax=Pararge aegeria TaxID=116150 RepID=S4NT39_9NEOP